MRRFKMNDLVRMSLLVCVFGVTTLTTRMAQSETLDLTVGGNAASYVVREDILKHTYNLGPTGMRGWIHESWQLDDNATQILVTRVDAESPADGLMQVGDVILGVNGKSFVRNTRRTFALAIGVAESDAQKGVMPLSVWRDGKTQTIDLQLKVVGSYSDTAPYNCPKSAKILEAGCRFIANKGHNWGRFNLEGMVLMGSGDKQYENVIRERATAHVNAGGTADFIAKVDSGVDPMGSAWNGGYGGLLWTDYCLSRSDKRFLPWVRANALNVARGQGMWGTYGHGYSLKTSDGKLHGIIPPYGALNQSGLACFLTMVMAKQAGVQEPEIDAAIERANTFFRYYSGKGTIPYGEHRPEVWRGHDNNGTSGLAAHAFAAQGDRGDDARFWGMMSTASYAGLEYGHTGPFFSFLWGTLGASVAGPKAAAAYFKEIAWHYDLERRHDGSFAYSPGGGTHEKWSRDNRGISATGAYLLTFALPKRLLTITGRAPNKKIWLNDTDVAQAIQAGRFAEKEKSIDELFVSLRSWSPAERVTAAQELAKRDEDTLARVTALAEGKDLDGVIGACHVLAHLGERAQPALPLLIRLLEHDNAWVRVQAADALKTLGSDARQAVTAMLKAIAITDTTDPLRFGQGSLSYALFYPGGNVAGKAGLLAKSIDGLDRDLLYPAIRAVAVHPDGHARGCLRSTYTLLTMDDIKALMPEIATSIKEMAPCNTMFSKGAMLAGVKMLASHRIAEGMDLGMGMLEMWRFHGRNYVEKFVSDQLKSYGGAAKPILERLKAESEKRPNGVSIREAIEVIEGDENPLPVIHVTAAPKK